MPLIAVGSSVARTRSEVARVTALRALRVLRMLKLVRLARGTRIFRRWENRLSINYAVLSIVNICVMLVFICHLFACAWGLQVGLTMCSHGRPSPPHSATCSGRPSSLRASPPHAVASPPLSAASPL